MPLYGFPSSSYEPTILFCQSTTSLGVMSHILFGPKNGTIFVRMMCSLVSQVLSLSLGLTSSEYLFTNASKGIDMDPSAEARKSASHAKASPLVANPRFTLCLRLPSMSL